MSSFSLVKFSLAYGIVKVVFFCLCFSRLLICKYSFYSGFSGEYVLLLL